MILFVSPHLDDVALSCGGLVKRLVSAGQTVLIATVCTNDAPSDRPLSEAAQREHSQWQLGDQPYRRRREEDRNACASLGARFVHLGLLDAPYRRDEHGAPLYTYNFIGGEVHPYDWKHQGPEIVAALSKLVSEAAQVYSPLAIGDHVDHVIVRRAVEELMPRSASDPVALNYYEDYPYAAKRVDVIETEQRAAGLKPGLIELTQDESDARIRAIACYASQIPILFKSAEAMPEHVRSFIAQVGGERYWGIDEDPITE